jgi:hypothetical protein
VGWVAFAAPRPALAQTWAGWTAYWENDSFVLAGGSDDAFTNGVRLAVARHPNAEADKKFDWLESWLGRHLLFGRDLVADTTTSLVAGQNFFTPIEITTYTVDPTDRPYAGYSYLGLRADLTERAAQELDPDDPLSTRDKAFQSLRQHSVEVNLGVIGPAAGAEPVQSSVHAALRTHRVPKGWYTQMGNSLGVSANYMVRQKIGWHFFDLVPHGGLMVGTTQIYPFAGATARLGWNMTGFPALIGRNTAVNAVVRPAWELGVIAGAEGRYFIRNSFVQGTIFGGGEGIDLYRPVGDYRLGFFTRLLDWRFTYTFLRRSPEVAEEGPSFMLYDNYGSISFAYEPGPAAQSAWVDFIINDFFGTLLDDFILEAGIGPDLYDEREDFIDQTHGMHVAVGRALPWIFHDFDLVGEVVGVGREFRPPLNPLDDHVDRFLVNSLITLRYRPLGGRLGPGEYSVRAGIGSAKAKVEVTPAVTGDRVDPCPPGTTFEDPDDNLRYCSNTDEGTGYNLGLAYTLDFGKDFGFNTDLSWNQLDDIVGDDRFLALTFGFRWAPRERPATPR